MDYGRVVGLPAVLKDHLTVKVTDLYGKLATAH